MAIYRGTNIGKCQDKRLVWLQPQCLLHAGSVLDQLRAYLCNYLRALKLETTAFAQEPLYFFLYFDLLYFLKSISFNLIGHD